jgi:hypothetical protein
VAVRPCILNGIEDVVTRPDLADRAIFLMLETIAKHQRQPEAHLWAEFERARPLILGALLDAVAHGLGQLPSVRLDQLPRMADFAMWAVACETAIWPEGAFMAAYGENIEGAIVGVIEADPVADAVRAFMAGKTQWRDTATALLASLEFFVAARIAKAKSWPANGKSLSGRLRRAAPALRAIGIEIDFDEKEKGNRVIQIRHVPVEVGNLASAASVRPQPLPDSQLARTQPWTQAASPITNASMDVPMDALIDDADVASNLSSTAKPLKGNGLDATDALDAKIPTQTEEQDDDRQCALGPGGPGDTLYDFEP